MSITNHASVSSPGDYIFPDCYGDPTFLVSGLPSAKAPKGKETTKGKPRKLPGIEYEPQRLDESVRQSIALLAEHPRIYSQSGRLIYLGSKAVPVTLTEPYLTEILTQLANWTVKGTPSHAPDRVVRAILARREWSGIRPLKAVSPIPVIDPITGEVTTSGYHPGTGVYVSLSLPTSFKIGSTIEDARAARLALLDLVSEFPFKTDTDKDAWLAMLLSCFARHWSNHVPLFLITANQRGSGKTLLTDLVSYLISGKEAPRTPWAATSEESRKSITASVRERLPLVLEDNVRTGSIWGNEALANLATSLEWSDRILHSQDKIHIDVATVWVATGNNVSIEHDVSRRTLVISLRTALEHPDRRSGYRYPDLIGHILAHRSEYLGHAATILRSYILAGKPDQGMEPAGTFTLWVQTVASAIKWAGGADVGALRGDKVAPSDTSDAVCIFLQAWESLNHQQGGATLTAGEVLMLCGKGEYAPSEEARAMYEAIRLVAGTPRGDLPTPKSFGMYLRGIVDQPRTLEDGRVVALQVVKTVQNYRHYAILPL
jgi:hypothetical protein